MGSMSCLEGPEDHVSARILQAVSGAQDILVDYLPYTMYSILDSLYYIVFYIPYIFHVVCWAPTFGLPETSAAARAFPLGQVLSLCCAAGCGQADGLRANGGTPRRE